MGFPCPNCGTVLEGTERFCRKCGTRILPEDLHEASTRSFDTPPAGAAPNDAAAAQGTPTNRFGPSITEPAQYVPPHYGAPGAAVPPGVPAYAGGAPVTGPIKKGRNWKFILLAIFGVVALFCATGGWFLYSTVSRVSEKVGFSAGPEGVRIRDKKTGKQVQIGKPAPDQLPEDVKKWYYPGASVVSLVNATGERGSQSVLSLTTNDDAKKVGEYYRQLAPKDAHVVREDDASHTSIVFEKTVIDIMPQRGLGQATQINIILGAGEDPHGPPDGEWDPEGEEPEMIPAPVQPGQHPSPPHPPPPSPPPPRPPAR